MLGFGSRLSEGKVLDTPHLHCTQYDPSLVLGLLCLPKGCLLKLLISLINVLFQLFTKEDSLLFSWGKI